MKLHPDTGRHYVVSFPHAPAFIDVRTGYKRIAPLYSWLTVISQSDYLQGAYRDDDTAVLVLWHGSEINLKHRAKVIEVYNEAIGDESTMLPEHIRHRDEFIVRAQYLTGAFAHTPKMAEYVGKFCKSAVLPAGWDPTRAVRKSFRREVLSYWGSDCGQRRRVLSELSKHVEIEDHTGKFGEELLFSIADTAATLYIPHSNVWSFSTWRSWQSVTTAIPMFVPGSLDIWPMTTEDVIEVPWFPNGARAGSWFKEMLADRGRLTQVADRLRDRFYAYTIDRIVPGRLVQACEEVCE